MDFKFPIEMLDRALSHPNIEVEKAAVEGQAFKRIRNFKVCGKEYSIKWYRNGCYLFHHGIEIPFQSVIQKNTWPNHAKVNLQFYDSGLEVCCVLPIEYYEKDA